MPPKRPRKPAAPKPHAAPRPPAAHGPAPRPAAGRATPRRAAGPRSTMRGAAAGAAGANGFDRGTLVGLPPGYRPRTADDHPAVRAADAAVDAMIRRAAALQAAGATPPDAGAAPTPDPAASAPAAAAPAGPLTPAASGCATSAASPAGSLDPAAAPPPPPPIDWPAAAPPRPPRRGDDRPPFRYRSVPEDLAIHLAHRLSDMASLEYYLRLTHRWASGRLLPRMERIAVGHTLMRKAAVLAAQGPPRGPLRNPAAVFVTWVRSLERLD